MAVTRREQSAAVSAAAVSAGEKAASGGGRVRPIVHSQVRKIKEEDLRIGEGTGEGLSAWDRELIALLHLNPGVSAASTALCSRPMLPASPLGNKSAVIGSPLA